MKLSKFMTRAGEQTPCRAAALPALTANPSDSRIRLNLRARVALGLKRGDKVSSYRDEESPTRDWYIAKRGGRGSLTLDGTVGNHLYGTSEALSRELMASARATKQRRFVLAPAGEGYLKIVGYV